MYYEKTLSSDFIPPETFLYLDQKGFIQDDIPLINHYFRHNNNKKFGYPPHSSSADPNIKWRYSMSILNPNKEKNEERGLLVVPSHISLYNLHDNSLFD